MQVKSKNNNKHLTILDFAFIREPEIGLTYQYGPYMILVGRASYSCTYRGQTFSWGHESLTEAIRAVEAFEAKRLRDKCVNN